MIFLCCDTNVWIDISNGHEPARLLDRLYSEIRDDNIKLLLPEIVVSEWNRNKNEKIIEKISKDTTNQTTSLTKLSEFLEINENFMYRHKGDFSVFNDEVNGVLDNNPTSEIRNKIDGLLKDLKTHRGKIEATAKENIKLVEDIFNHPNTVLLPTDEKSSKIVVQLAIEHKFPFDKKKEKPKNTFADCLIFYQFINYLKENSLKNAHFVTANKEDFFPKKYLHEQYEEERKLTESVFHKSLTDALSTSLNEDLVSFKERKWMEEMEWEAAENGRMEDCECCGNTVLLNELIPTVDNRDHSDPNQLSLFPTEIQYLLDPSTEELPSGYCSSCSTLTVECPECHSTWCFCDGGYWQNTPQKCSECNLIFIYHTDFPGKGETTEEYIEILNPLGRCEECGNENEYDPDGNEYCLHCFSGLV